VVAEGVEDEATFELLRHRGCDAVQGHLFAKTMRLDGFTQWLHQGRAGGAVQLGR
jgi:EAL domain-containing protein (putative c-di-GMP-specific phosphodiesterase class I)